MSVWTYAKRISKSTLAILVSVCALLLLCPVSPLPAAAAADADPQYMLRMTNGGAGITYRLNVGTDIPEGTYIFAFEYFCDPDAAAVNADARFFGGGYSRLRTAKLLPGRNTMRLEYTYAAADGQIAPGVLMPGVNGAVGDPDIYLWNFSLTVKDGDGTNYLTNFENRKFNGWRPGDQPDADAAANGQFTILDYDGTLVDPFADKQYMLKVDSSVGTTGFGKRFVLGSDVPAGTNTYVFSFEYYIDPASTGLMFGRYYNGSYGCIDHNNLYASGLHTFSKEYTIDSSLGAFIVGLELRDSAPVYGYFWNFSLTVKDGDGTNYLTNFENRRFGDWDQDNFSKNIKDNGRYTVVEFDEILVGLDDGKTYMLKMDLDKAVSSGQRWSALNVSDYAGTDLTAAEIPGTYTFSYDYFVQYSQGDKGIQNRIYVGGSDSANIVTYGTLEAGRGTFTKTFTVTEENPTFSLQLMAAESKGGVAYFWNLRLTREGSNDNRLVNKSLRKGTLKGWRYVNQYGYIDDTATEKEYFSVEEYDNARTTLYGLGTSVRAGNEPGLRFGFTIANQGIDYADPLNESGTRTNYAGDLSQATVLVDGTAHRVLDMGVLVSIEEQAVLDRTAVAVKAKKLFAVQNGVATFTAVIVDIPENRLDTTIYACSFVEYETEEGSAFLYGAVLSDSYNGALARATA